MSARTGTAGFEPAPDSRVEVSPDELARALEVAHAAADRARAETLPRFRHVAVETKRDGSPVTEADRAAERAIREVIGAAFPDDAILGEEYGAERGGARRRWTVDPIDGTIAFSRGIPLFTTLIALAVDDEPVLGLIDLPAVGDRIHGVLGGGAWRGDERVEVSRIDDPERALICHGDPFCFERSGSRGAWERMAARLPTLRGYTDAFGHGLVLSGAADAMVDCDLKPWDATATRVLIREAQGACWLRSHAERGTVDLVFGSPGLVPFLVDCFAS